MKNIIHWIVKATVRCLFLTIILQCFFINVISASAYYEKQSFDDIKIKDERAEKDNFKTGMLKGRVVAAEDTSGLQFVAVIVVGTNNCVTSDHDGRFILSNIEAGKQKIKFSYVGCNTKIVEVTILPDTTLEITVSLQHEAVKEKDEAISTQARGQLFAINEQLSSNKVVNIVPAEKMRELPDANLAESIGRLPGVSLERTNGEANKINLRGLSAKFTKVTIEGVPMVPSNGLLAPSYINNGSSISSDRRIDLSLISDDMINGIEVSKSLRADMDADALGGTINLTLKKAQHGLHYDIQSNGGYYDLTSNWKNYKISGSVSNRFFDNALGIRLQLNAEDKTLPLQQFDAVYDDVSPITSIDYTTGERILTFVKKTNSAGLTVDNLDSKRYGGSMVLDYESDFVDILFLNTYNQKNDNDAKYENDINFQSTDGLFFSNLYSSSRFKTEQRMHSLQSKFKLGGSELNVSLSYTKVNYSNPGYDFHFQQYGPSDIIKPDELIFGNPAELMTAVAKYSNPNNSSLVYLNVTDNFLNDNTYDAKIDYTVPFRISDSFSGKIFIGGKYHEMDRSKRGSSSYYDMRWIDSYNGPNFLRWLQQNYNAISQGMNYGGGVSSSNFMDNNYRAPKFLNGRYSLDSWGYDLGLLTDIGKGYYEYKSENYFINGSQTYNSIYDGKEKLRAGYLMAELNAGKDLTIVPGVRYEEQRNTYGAYLVYTNNSNQDGLAGRHPEWRTFNTTNVNYFPSLYITYKADENIQLIGDYYKSAARPDFSSISPLIDYNYYSINATNNPYLKPAIATNFDLGASLFSNTIGLFSVNVFYKEIKDLAYFIQGYMPFKRADIIDAPSDFFDRVPGMAYFDSTWLRLNPSAVVPINNPAKAYIKGLELSWQTHLWYLPGVLSGLTLDLNLSFMKSHTEYPYFDSKIVPKDTIWYPNHTRPITINYYQAYRTRSGALLNQPKAICNATIGWDYLGFSSRVSFKYQPKTLAGLDLIYSMADTYYDDIFLVDIALKQKVVGNLSVFANFINIGSHIDDYYYTSPKGNLPTSSQGYGFSAQFGLSFYY